MGLREKFARRYAPLERPRHLKSPEPYSFAAPEISKNHFRATRTSQNLALTLGQAGVSRDLRPKCKFSIPQTLPFSVSPTAPAITLRDLSILVTVGVSDNLLTPIGTPDPKGRNYEESSSQHALFDPGKVKDFGRSGEPRKAYGEKRDPVSGTTARTFAGIWAMILPLLKPPLDFNFPTQLDLPSELIPFQLEGIKKLLDNKSFLLGDEMGTGKTVMTTVALRVLFNKGLARRALVVCPASIRSVWDDHLLDWGGPEIQCTNVVGRRQVRQIDWEQPAHVYIVSYDTFRNDVLGERKLLDENKLDAFDVVILDEIHHIRNSSSGRARAVKKLVPEFRWGLSGTPLQNSMDDLRGVFGFLKPGLFPEPPSSPAEAREKIQPFFLRRLKRDVMKDLPEKTKEEIWLEMDREQRRAYKEILHASKRALSSEKTGVTRAHIFATIQKLMQICNFASGHKTSPKLRQLEEHISELVQEHKVVVFTNYRPEGVAKIRPTLAEHGLVVITGGTPDRQRKRFVKEFQENDDKRVFLGTAQAAGEGIDLTAATYVFHFDQWWNPFRALQAEDRVHRKGQDGQVSVYSYFMEDSIEQRIRQKLKEKGLLFDEVITELSEEGIRQKFTMDDWLGLIDLDMSVKGESAKPEPQAQTPEAIYARFPKLSPREFEELTAEVLRATGYSTKLTGQSHDRGIDVLATGSGLGGRERIAVQCKRKRQVGVDVARELLGTVSSDTRLAKGILVVSGEISSECRRFVEQHGNLFAIEGFGLAKMVVDHQITL